MKLLRQINYYNKIQFNSWHKNIKILLIFISIFFLLISYLIPIEKALVASALKITPLQLYPFIISNKYICVTVFTGLLIILTNIPLDYPYFKFAITRSGLRPFILGQILYCFITAIIYFSFILITIHLFFWKHIKIETDWNNILFILGFTDLGNQYLNSIIFHKTILLNYSANSAIINSLSISIVSGMLFSMTYFTIRLSGLKKLSFFPFVVICLNFSYPAIPRKLLRFAPTIWTNLNVINSLNINVPNIISIYIELFILLILLTLMSLYICKNKKEYLHGND